MNTLRNSATNLRALLVSVAATLGSLLLCPISAHAQGGVPLWTNVYRGAMQGGVSFDAIAVDSDGNVFASVVGATIKYSGQGVPLWTNSFGGGPIALDDSGSLFVQGSLGIMKCSNSGTPLWTNLVGGDAIALDSGGNLFLTVGGVNGGETMKYSGEGTFLWKNLSGGGRIAVHANGNVFVVGSLTDGGGNSDYATIAYSNAGAPLWTNRYNGPGNSSDNANAITVDNSGNVFVTGWSLSSAGNQDFATVKYSSSGVPLWTNRYNGPRNDHDGAYAMALDGSGNVFVAGFSQDDCVTIKYSNSGTLLWTRRYNGPGNGSDSARAVAVDSSGNVFVTGQDDGGSTGGDYAIIAYSNSGMPLWTNRYSGPGITYDFSTAVALDRRGNVFIIGYSYYGSTDGHYDYVTIKYSSSVPPPRLCLSKAEQPIGAELDERRVQFASRARSHGAVHQPAGRCDESLHERNLGRATILPVDWELNFLEPWGDRAATG